MKGLSLVAVLVATILLFNVVVDDYLSARFVSRLLIAVSITALLAAGESLVIITRNIDLSVGSTVGVAAYLTAELLANHRGSSGRGRGRGRDGDRGRPRARQRVSGGGRQGAVDHRHARNAVDLPQRADQPRRR